MSIFRKGCRVIIIAPAIYMCQLDGKPIPVPNLTAYLMPYGLTRLQQVM